MKDLFQQIVDTNPVIPGWCVAEKACELAAAVLALHPKCVVEIGVFGGRSLIPMALACKALGHGVVVGIDPWTAAASTEGYTEENRAWWGALNHDELYAGFMQRLTEMELGGFTFIQRERSDDAALPKGPIDILHIDGQHTDQAVRDVLRYASKVRVGGLVFADDITWAGGGVARSVEALKKLGFIKLYDRDTGAMFQRVED